MFVLVHPPAVQPGCARLGLIQSTQFPDLFLRELDQLTIPKIQTEGIDIELELRLTAAYLVITAQIENVEFDSRVTEQLCHLNKELPSLAESPFKHGKMMRRRGDVTVEFGCVNRIVQAKIGEDRTNRCLFDLLPVWDEGRPRYLYSVSHTLIDHPPPDENACGDNTQSSLFQTRDGRILQAWPTVEFVKLPIHHPGREYLQNLAKLKPELESNELLYSREQLQQYHSMVLLEHAKQYLVQKHVKQECSKGRCGGFFTGYHEDSWLDKINPVSMLPSIDLQWAGSIAGCIALALWLLKFALQFCLMVKMWTKGANLRTAVQANFTLNTQLALLIQKQHLQPDLQPAHQPDDLQLESPDPQN